MMEGMSSTAGMIENRRGSVSREFLGRKSGALFLRNRLFASGEVSRLIRCRGGPPHGESKVGGVDVREPTFGVNSRIEGPSP